MPRDSHPHAELTPTWCRSQVELHQKKKGQPVCNDLQPPTAMSRSLTKTFVDTLALASRHTLAAADFKAAPLPPNTPETAHADGWPNTSWRRPHRHAFAAREMGRRNRRNNKMRNGWGSKRRSLDVGTHVNGHAASGPPCERKIALSASDKDGTTLVNTNEVSVHLDARCYQPCLGW